MTIVANNQTSEVAKPGESAFDLPAFAVATHVSSIVHEVASSIRSVRGKEKDPALFQTQAQWIAVVTAVGDDSQRFFGSTTTEYADRGQGRLGKADLVWSATGQLASQRNTLAVDHHHPLRALATLGFADCVAPFLAGTKLPSRKLSLQSRRSPWSSSLRNARQIRSHTPCCSQRCNLLQHTLGLTPMSLGRSRQRAPVLRIQRMPSNTTRFSLGGRPRRRRLSLGKSGSIFCHCCSESNGSRMTIFSQSVLYRTSSKFFAPCHFKNEFRNHFY